MTFDLDLSSIPETHDLAQSTFTAQYILAKASQTDVDHVCQTMAEIVYQASEQLGLLAYEETGYGVVAY